VNRIQRESTVGWVVDVLEEMARDLAAGMPDLDPEQREGRWARIQALCQARDQVTWSVKQAHLHVLRGKIGENAPRGPTFQDVFQDNLL
jgi:hypothetical protein